MSTNNYKFKQTDLGEIPVVTLQDYCELIQYGYTQSASKEEVGPKFLRITDIQTKPVDWNSVPFCKISEKDFNKYILKEGDILIARTGASTGTNSIYENKMPKSVFASYLIRIRLSSEFNSKYVHYFLQSKYYSDYIAGILGGSAQPNANAQQLTNVLINKFNLNTQKQIASILSSLDDKIELNQKTIKTLEEIGQALFKRWFVDFEFPNEKGEPYKSSGGEMVESELGEIPKGWSVDKINSFGKVICGKTPSKDKDEYFNGDTPFIKIPDMHGNMYITETTDSLTKLGADSQSSKYLPKDSICVSCIATVGLVSLTSKQSQTNQQINGLIPNEEFYKEYLFFTLKNSYDFLNNLASGGSATLNMNTQTFSNIEIIKPNQKTLILFHEKLNTIFENILNLQKENISIKSIRDSLLPKLLSGKIRV